MSPDEFDLRKTGRFAVPLEPPAPPADEEEDTQTREHPAAPSTVQDPNDPAFEKRKTQIFRRPNLPTAPADDEEGDFGEESTGEYERTKTGRFQRRDPDAD